MVSDNPEEQFLRPPSDEEEDYAPVYRSPSAYSPLSTFILPRGEMRHFQQQYADIYFLRLARLKPAVSEIAVAAWEGFNIAGEYARRVDRVLDVRQGELCWVAGTVYMDLPLKPNILDDISKEHWTAAPPSRKTYLDPSNQASAKTMLEDESGRLQLTGTLLQSALLVTGAIVAVLGTENVNGDFEVIDIKVPDLPAQPERWERSSSAPQESAKRKHGSLEHTRGGTGGKRKKIAMVSGLGITGTSGDTVALSLLTDYLLGYNEPHLTAQTNETNSPPFSSQITRLIIAGNSLGSSILSTQSEAENGDSTITAAKKRHGPKKYGYDAAAYNASPINHFDTFLAEILPSIPITLMPGETDPANFSLPQQEIHRAMFPRSKAYCSAARPGTTGEPTAEPGWLDNVTNPWEGDVEGWRFWGCSGQNVDDMLRYIDLEAEGDGLGGNESDRDGEARLRLMEAMLRWRCAVPTAPDTLWCYPYQTHDPFILQSCPHVFFAGNQPSFRTAIVESSAAVSSSGIGDEQGMRVRIITLPKFSETGEIVLVDVDTLEVEVVRFGTFERNAEDKLS
ncbi:DNA polymerase subunit delta-2 [Paracoccidioides lutzii Pb01]|uniref:DNA-directed DNA polymerase n=1 Tax=Paracoccidioides lutzii (strain ATCC MYA-826 / Pb01) TaxID=502779 RepID=C1GQB6_PARBA|nr:DNA polymerase subunit delta-2 [Paracoccidioides lutzii Pb01]EEH37790.2 DNA polymerase subunit delta-2 [Paracoccidioides lutzii Pb01]